MFSFWRCFDRLAGGRALLTVWQSVFENDFARVHPFLHATPDCAERFPCRDCDCDHEVREDFEWDLAGVCTCGECEPIPLTRADTIIHALDQPALGAAVCRALGFATSEPCRPHTGWQAVPIGLHAPLQSPIYMYVPPSEAALLREIEKLVGTRPGPFLLLTPTRRCFTPEVDAILNRAAGAAIALDTILDPQLLTRHVSRTLAIGHCQSAICPPIHPSPTSHSSCPSHPSTLLAPILADWATHAAGARDHGRTLLDIHREIAAVRHDFVELRTAKQRLEKMLTDGLFKFTQKVDATAFKILCAILAEGDVAKAGRRLGLSDPLMRHHLRQWSGKGAAYGTMLDLVRWRKQMGRKETMPLNDAILHEKAVTTDYPGLLSDVLDGLLSMTDTNWQDLCEELKALLRQAQTSSPS